MFKVKNKDTRITSIDADGITSTGVVQVVFVFNFQQIFVRREKTTLW